MSIHKHIIIIGTEKGGERKTTLTASIAGFLIEASYSPRIFQVDDQSRLPTYFGDLVTSLGMPDQNKMRRNDLADAEAIQPFSETVFAGEEPYILLDLGANTDGRVMDAFATLEIDQLAEDNGYRVIAFVPMSSDGEAVLLGARTVERIKIALPNSDIVVVRNEDGGQISDLPPAISAKYLEAKDGNMEISHPRLLPRVLNTIERATENPWSLPNMRLQEFMKMTSTNFTIARTVLGDIEMWKADLSEAFEMLEFCGREVEGAASDETETDLDYENA